MNLETLSSRNIGRLVGPNVEFSSVSTDTRTIKPGQLFVAIKGERFDAHDNLAEAVEKGACAIVVERDFECDLPRLIVEDSIIALGEIANLHRQTFTGKVLALTGSCGKTTVKDMLAHICMQAGSYFATQGNLNNHIGVPLTLLSIDTSVEYAIIEAGTNSKGEIAYLADIIQPDIALVNNVMSAHLEGFGSVAAIAEEKSAIYHCDDTQVAIVNLDDSYSETMLSKVAGKKILGFSCESEPKEDIHVVRCKDFTVGENGHTQLIYNIEELTQTVELKVLGSHNIKNALAAISCAHALGIDHKAIKVGLESYLGTKSRMQVRKGLAGSVIVDDSYNANPDAMKAAIDFISQKKHATLICGDMNELGIESEVLHGEIGAYAREKGVDTLLATGKYGEAVVKGYGDSAQYFSDKQDLIEYLGASLVQDQWVLVKGSRGAKMEIIVDALSSSEEQH